MLSGEETFFLAFVRNLPMVPSGEEASFPCHLWHSAHSVPEKASCGTEYARRAQNRLVWYAAHFQGLPVRKTGFSGTGVVFGAGNRLLWYAAHFQGHSVLKKGSCGTEGIFGTGNPLLWYAAHFQGLPVRKTGFSGTGVILNFCKGSTNREKYKK